MPAETTVPTTTPFYFEHALDAIKGWPSPYAVDKAAALSPNVNCKFPAGGRVVHLNSAGQFEMGSTGTQVPMVLIQGANDFDVANPSPGGRNTWYGVEPAGVMSALVSLGAFELLSTEYDPTSGVTFNVNDPLHAPTEAQILAAGGADVSLAGALFNAKNWPGGDHSAIAPYADAVCGYVSAPLTSNSQGAPALQFWPAFLPGATAAK